MLFVKEGEHPHLFAKLGILAVGRLPRVLSVVVEDEGAFVLRR